MQATWLSKKTDEIQQSTDCKGMKNFYSALKLSMVQPHQNHLIFSVLVETHLSLTTKRF